MNSQDPDDPSWVLPRGVMVIGFQFHDIATGRRLSPAEMRPARPAVRVCGYPRCDRPATKDGHCAEGHPGVRYDR